MIPTTDLLRLLDHIIGADRLRSEPERIRVADDGFGADYDELDPQSFATLARIAAGEAWEDEWKTDRVSVPRNLLDNLTIYQAARALENEGGDDAPPSEAVADLRRLSTLVRTL